MPKDNDATRIITAEGTIYTSPITPRYRTEWKRCGLCGYHAWIIESCNTCTICDTAN